MGLFKKICNAVKDAVVDVVSAPVKIVKESIEFTQNILEGDFKGAFKDLTQMIGPALTIVATVGTFGAGGIAINIGKQMALTALKNVAIRAGGNVLSTVLGEAGVKGPVAGALVSVATSFAGGGFKIDASTAAKTVGKAALSAAAEDDGTLGDVAKVANVAVSVVGSDGKIKVDNAGDVADIAVEVGKTGVLGDDVEKASHVAGAALTIADGVKAKKAANNNAAEGEAEDEAAATDAAATEAPAAAASADARAASGTPEPTFAAAVEGGEEASPELAEAVTEAAQTNAASTENLNKAASASTDVAQTATQANQNLQKAKEILDIAAAVGSTGLFGEEVKKASVMVDGMVDYTSAIAKDGVTATEAIQAAAVAVSLVSKDEEVQTATAAIASVMTYANKVGEDGYQAREILDAAIILADSGIMGEDIQTAAAYVSTATAAMDAINNSGSYIDAALVIAQSDIAKELAGDDVAKVATMVGAGRTALETAGKDGEVTKGEVLMALGAVAISSEYVSAEDKQSVKQGTLLALQLAEIINDIQEARAQEKANKVPVSEDGTTHLDAQNLAAAQSYIQAINNAQLYDQNGIQVAA